MAAAVLGLTAAIMAIAVIGWTQLAGDTPRSGWLALPAWAPVRSVSYVLIGLAVLVAGGTQPGPFGPVTGGTSTAGQRGTP